MFQHTTQPPQQQQQQQQQQHSFRFSNAAAPTQQQAQARSVHSTPMHSHHQSQPQTQQQPLSLYTASSSAPFHRGVNMQPLQPHQAPVVPSTPYSAAPAQSVSAFYPGSAPAASVFTPATASFYPGSSTPSHPSNTAHSQLLYQYLLPLEVHATGKDRCRALMILSVSSSFTSSQGLTARSIQLQCHQESDPYFLYYSQVSEQDFPRIKQAQNLNVDFSNLAAEIERQVCGVEGARKIGVAANAAEMQGQMQTQQQQEIGSPSSSAHAHAHAHAHGQQFESLYPSSSAHGDAHNSSTLSLATGSGSSSSGSGSGSGSSMMVRDDMMSAQFLMHSSPSSGSSGGPDASAEFKLIYRHNFRMMDILSLSFVRASETQLKKFMVEGWGAEKSGRMAAESEIRALRSQAQSLEAALEEARNRINLHSLSSDSAAHSLKIACEAQVLEDREVHAQALASLRQSHEAEMTAAAREWESKLTAAHSKIEALTGELQKTLAEKASLHTRLSTLTIEHEHLQAELRKNREERSRDREALQAAEASLATLQSEATKSSIRLAQLESAITEKSSVIALLQSAAHSETQKQTMVSESLSATKKDLAHLQSKYQAVCGELQRGNEALSKLQAKLKAGKEKSLRAKEIQQSLEDRLAASEAAAKDASHKASSALQEKSFVESDRDRLITELKAAQRAIAEAAEHQATQEKMITYLNEQTTKAQMGKIGSAFTSSLMLQPSSATGVASTHTQLSTMNLGGGLRALDAGLTRPSFHSALATPLPNGGSNLEYTHSSHSSHAQAQAQAQQNNSMSPGAAPQSLVHVADSKTAHPTPAPITSATLSKSTRALLANKENAYNHASMFSPAAPSHNNMQPSSNGSSANARAPLTSRLTHSNNGNYQQTASSLAMHKAAPFTMQQQQQQSQQHDLSYYAPAAQA